MDKGFMIRPAPCPSTPLNLRLGVIYSPRVPTPPYAAFEAAEWDQDMYVIRGYNDQDGGIEIVFTGHLLRTYQNLAIRLRMDTTPPEFR